MRRFPLILITFVAVVSFGGYIDLTGGVKSGVLAIGSVGETTFFLVSQDDGAVNVFAGDAIKPDGNYTHHIELEVGPRGIPSTGAHVHWEDEDTSSPKVSYVFLAPNGGNLTMLYLDSSKFGKVNGLDNLLDEWGDITGGLAAFAATYTSDEFYAFVIGLNERGKLLVARVEMNTTTGTTTVDDSTNVVVYDADEQAYSTLAIDGEAEGGNTGTLRVYFGTDEAFYVGKLDWSITGVPATFVLERRIETLGTLQSGIAIGEHNVYFLTYGLNQAWFNVYNVNTGILYTYKVPAEPGEALPGFMENSPVVVSNGASERAFFAIGKAVYYYDSSKPGIEKWADVGSEIYTAPILLEDTLNVGNAILVVVTNDGKVYRVDYNDVPKLVSDECAGMGTVYSPPVARGGYLVFGMSKFDGTGVLCAIDIADKLDSPGAITGGGWPMFGFLDGRTQFKGYNPPYKLSVFVKGYIQDGSSLNGVGPSASYTTEEMSEWKEQKYDFSISVGKEKIATVCALDYEEDKYYFGGDVETLFKDPTDTIYEFDRWIDDASLPDPTQRCRSEEISDMRIYKARYTLKYKVYHELINVLDGKVIDVNTELVEAFDKYETEPNEDYIFVKWKVNFGGATEVEFSSPTLVIDRVESPILIKEYVKRVYGKMEVRYPKVLLEPVPGANRFFITLKVTKLSTSTAGQDATPIKAFHVDIDLSKLSLNASVVGYEASLLTDYPANVDATTEAFLDTPWFFENMISFPIVLSTPIEEATDIFIATLTIEYEGEGFPKDMDEIIPDDMFFAEAGDRNTSMGLLKVSTSKDPMVDYLPEFLAYTSILGDFNGDNCVFMEDFSALVGHYKLKPTDPGWDPRYDIGPRQGFVPPASPNGPYEPGYLIIPEDPNERTVDFNDLLIFALMFGYGCE